MLLKTLPETSKCGDLLNRLLFGFKELLFRSIQRNVRKSIQVPLPLLLCYGHDYNPHRRIVELEEIEADKVVKDIAPFLCQPSHEDFTLGKNQLNGHEVK